MDVDDWRLMGQEDRLSGRHFQLKTWTPYRDGWDHDHCEFCTREISDRAIGESSVVEDGTDPVPVGYVTSDDLYHWVCVDCFADFRDSFGFIVDPAGSEGSADS